MKKTLAGEPMFTRRRRIRTYRGPNSPKEVRVLIKKDRMNVKQMLRDTILRYNAGGS